MSLSLVFVPAVLVLRVVMGQEEFNNWTESSQVKMPTSFDNEIELVKTVKMAGYDAYKVGSLIKTHLNAEKQFFFWEKINGKWTAIFSKYDSQEVIRTFISNLESKAGRKLIYNSSDEIMGITEEPRTVSEIPPLPKVNTETYPTNFIDKTLLLKTLNEYGVYCKELSNEDIECSMGNCILNFHKEGQANYEVEIKATVSFESAYQHLTIIDEEYKQNVQEYTYEKVVKKLESSDMYIDKEEVLEDNSILLTITIGG
jgi:hypothetical protein